MMMMRKSRGDKHNEADTQEHVGYPSFLFHRQSIPLSGRKVMEFFRSVQGFFPNIPHPHILYGSSYGGSLWRFFMAVSYLRRCPKALSESHTAHGRKSLAGKRGNNAGEERLPKSSPRPFVIVFRLSACYQMVTRFSFGTNNGSLSVMPNASYQASMCGNAPFTRQRPSEWGSMRVRLRISSSRILPAHSRA